MSLRTQKRSNRLMKCIHLYIKKIHKNVEIHKYVYVLSKYKEWQLANSEISQHFIYIHGSRKNYILLNRRCYNTKTSFLFSNKMPNADSLTNHPTTLLQSICILSTTSFMQTYRHLYIQTLIYMVFIQYITPLCTVHFELKLLLLKLLLLVLFARR